MSIKTIEKVLSNSLLNNEINLINKILKYIKCDNCQRYRIKTKDIYNKCHCEYCSECNKIIIQVNLKKKFICDCERCDECEELKLLKCECEYCYEANGEYYCKSCQCEYCFELMDECECSHCQYCDKKRKENCECKFCEYCSKREENCECQRCWECDKVKKGWECQH